ncbi:hypothetical protein ASG90_06605 [Nocardioides sp. Soil797]|nr:hypothetical protein ASG90_06605 [Nocardioides sp. Soil797]
MEFCKNCGAGLGPGRFCTNCGMPVEPPRNAPSGTAGNGVSDPGSTTQGNSGPGNQGPGNPAESAAERTSVRLPAVQPDASTGPRFPLYAAPAAQPPQQQGPPPLFADEVPTRSPEQRSGPGGSSYAAHSGSAHAGPSLGNGRAVPDQSVPVDEIPPWQPPEVFSDSVGSHRSSERKKRSPWLWLLPLLLVLALGVGIGIWLGNRDSGDTTASDDTSQGPERPQDDATDPADPQEPDPGDDSGDDPDDDPANAVNLVDQLSASGPAPIKPGTDLSGNRVTYPPTNMLDDDPSTAYRLPGDASGRTITFELPDEATIHEVGLINGYAKTDTTGNRKVDWYPKNRRITEVEWSFDDGTTVTQTLRDSSDLQVINVDAAVTRTISLRIVSVSAPGRGNLSKNVTAISSVAVRGNSS